MNADSVYWLNRGKVKPLLRANPTPLLNPKKARAKMTPLWKPLLFKLSAFV